MAKKSKKSRKSRKSKKSSQGLASMSVDALFKLRDEVGAILSSKAAQLQSQLARLGWSTNWDASAGAMASAPASAVVVLQASVMRSRARKLHRSFAARRTRSSRGAAGVRWPGG